MAIFVRPVRLHGTRLFGTVVEQRHVLVLETDAETRSPNALVVPVPAPSVAGVEKVAPSELALGWDGRRRFFDDLDVHYHGPPVGRPGGGQAFFGVPTPHAATPVAAPMQGPSRLYPSFETSLDAVELFPSPAALGRLEPSLRPGPALSALLEQRWAGQPVALCPFPEGLGRVVVALSYAALDPTHLVFPLLEVTDGTQLDAEVYDEQLVLGQGIELSEQVLPYEARYPSLVPARPPPLPPFVRPEAPIDVASQRGRRPNADLVARVRGEV